MTISLSLDSRLGVLAVLSAMAAVVLDSGTINVALPQIGKALRVSPKDAILAVSAYQTALVIGLLPCAHIADRMGHRRIFRSGIALFGIASVICATATNLPALLIARVIQGLGGAGIMALGIAMLRLTLGPAKLGNAIGWNALTVAICSAAGPVAGAWVIAFLPWPWIFFAKLPVVVLSLLAARALPENVPEQAGFDIASIGLHASIVSFLSIAVGIAPAHHALAAIFVASAALLTRLLLSQQRIAKFPLWPLDLLAIRSIRVSALASICCFCGQTAGLLALTYYLQLGLGRGPVASGLIMACWPITVGITSLCANGLAQRFGSAASCVGGALLLASGLLVQALWQVHEDMMPIVFGAILGGLGFGLFQVPNNRILFLTAPSERSAAAGGIQGSARLIGQTCGALLVSLLLSFFETGLAIRFAFGAASLFAFASALQSARELPIFKAELNSGSYRSRLREVVTGETS